MKKQERREISAGCVVFTSLRGPDERSSLLYLVLRSGGVWGFPKGHIEKGESEVEAALRETREETGLKGILRVPGFKTYETYFKHAPHDRMRKVTSEKRPRAIFKIVNYFLASVPTTLRPRLSREHDEYAWVERDKALELLRYPGKKKVLQLADAFICMMGACESGKKVYICAALIPCGKVATYKDIARCAGVPARARWVGWVLNKNSDPSVPCHRVVESSGRIGGFNSGPKKKAAMLERERVRVDGGKVDLKTFGFHFYE
ncbi:MAG: hypothetical protein A3I44_05575 [Candidatus Sungbacteria bacterium RIFCSPLOWO2_02_FULL_51_17]|uniref:Bis(5'-nucleosyl)-tetraphosphatase [asymmetrical] n=1 Tax=Candidatus Sungbacteria bacterium RIFCSPHIGHO2_02_FULL_51_29 TaxID=1802273 RepID=A0A1G2KRB0_9BACT|nr:MAG: hypothetical protein A3C16_02455 [Candidatus Sungbacteria bacterium RIFCSPHIGHO2_02_FULL_51_29]OHA06501.1 MAG: hypothetical protein A3B29_02995 [Candidatus Sungbacteria bacterium RIFCSPLOWO2_01_FULL_51_34]OHA11163.1 MAG: hypothetical protein A3I44_05575 [Candidatus Sungbacteria bacterium RIFCSPLOWO2_02_FULL_51_17]